MKVTKIVDQTTAVEVVDDIKCNKCGSSMLDQDESFIRGCAGDMYFGYGSKRDTENHKFHLCDQCADELFASFVHPTEVTNEF